MPVSPANVPKCVGVPSADNHAAMPGNDGESPRAADNHTAMPGNDGESPPMVDPSLGKIGFDGLLAVFQLLPSLVAIRVAAVSKEWAGAMHAHLRATAVLDLAYSGVDGITLSRLLSETSPSLHYLHLACCHQLGAEVLIKLPLMAPTIAFLDLSETAVDGETLYHLLASLQGLRSITVDGCTLLSDIGLATHACELKSSLTSLSIARCPLLSGGASLAMLIRLCGERLTALDASGYEELGASQLR